MATLLKTEYVKMSLSEIRIEDFILFLFSIKMTGKIIRPAPAEIEFTNLGRNMRFLITDQPQVEEEGLDISEITGG